MATRRSGELAQSEHADNESRGDCEKESELRNLRQRLYNQGREHKSRLRRSRSIHAPPVAYRSQAVMSRVTNRSAVVRPDILWAITFFARVDCPATINVDPTSIDRIPVISCVNFGNCLD